MARNDLRARVLGWREAPPQQLVSNKDITTKEDREQSGVMVISLKEGNT